MYKPDGSRESFQEGYFGGIKGDRGSEIRKDFFGDTVIDNYDSGVKSSSGGAMGVPVPSLGIVHILIIIAVGAALLFSVKHAPEHLEKAFTTIGNEFTLIVIPWMLQFLITAIMVRTHFLKNRDTTAGRMFLRVMGAGLIVFVIWGAGILTAAAISEQDVGFFEYIIVMPIGILMHSAGFLVLLVPTAFLESQFLHLFVRKTADAKAGKISWIIIAIIATVLAVIGTVVVMHLLAEESGFDVRSDEQAESGEAYMPGAYDAYADDFILPGSDEFFYEESDIEDLDLDDTQTAINEIYARHGRIFREDPDYSRFNSFEWYHPIYPAEEFDDSCFNEYEKSNIDLLARHRADLKDRSEEGGRTEGSSINKINVIGETYQNINDQFGPLAKDYEKNSVVYYRTKGDILVGFLNHDLYLPDLSREYEEGEDVDIIFNEDCICCEMLGSAEELFGIKNKDALSEEELAQKLSAQFVQGEPNAFGESDEDVIARVNLEDDKDFYEIRREDGNRGREVTSDTPFRLDYASYLITW
ncbi:MAG: YARHG domain-containing protein [Firmicutes bacterium]|nr:YARHG domain-containing protein [Bacillota bacterium]